MDTVICLLLTVAATCLALAIWDFLAPQPVSWKDVE